MDLPRNFQRVPRRRVRSPGNASRGAVLHKADRTYAHFFASFTAATIRCSSPATFGPLASHHSHVAGSIVDPRSRGSGRAPPLSSTCRTSLASIRIDPVARSVHTRETWTEIQEQVDSVSQVSQSRQWFLEPSIRPRSRVLILNRSL